MGAILGALTVEEWIQLALAAPALLNAAQRAGEALHPAVVRLAEIFQSHVQAGGNVIEAATKAGTEIHGKWTSGEEAAWFAQAQGTV